MMKLDYHSLLNRVAWILLLFLLPTWGLTEFLLARWGETRYPINTYLDTYTTATDLLFLGDSRMSAGINPLVLDQKLSATSQGEPVLSSHNLGVQGTSFGIYYLILKQVIEQNKTPRVLIVGYAYNELTETFFFEGPDLAEVSEPEDWPLLRRRSLQDMDAFLDLVLQSVSRIYRYRFHIRSRVTQRAERYLSAVSEAQPQQPSTDTDTVATAAESTPSEGVRRPGQGPPVTENQLRAEQERGFRRHISLTENLDSILERERRTYQDWFWKPENWDVDPAQTFLADMIALSQEHGIELIVVKMPTTQLYTQMEARSPYVSDYEQQLDRYLQTHGITHFDLSQSMEDRYLWDTIHLTPEGAEQFTIQFYDQIIQPHLSQWVE